MTKQTKLYPSPALSLGNKYQFSMEEKGKVLLNLSGAWHSIDPEFKRFLNESNLSPYMETIFCCWGHPNNFILMFRSSLSIEETFIELLNPLQEKYHYSNALCDLQIGMHPWQDENNMMKFGYCITFNHASDKSKESFLQDVLMHLSLIERRRNNFLYE